MQISFRRSGGFAGPATNVQGTVNLDNNPMQVTSGNTGYRRELSRQEAEQLRQAVNALRNSTAQNEPPLHSSPVRDSYRYYITVGTANGEKQEVEINPAGDSPELAYLARWIQQETQKIWAYRIKDR